MRIIVCIKQVNDSDNARLEKAGPVTGRHGKSMIINPFDYHAIEEGMKLKERVGGHVTILSFGAPEAEKALREALSFGADDAFLVTDDCFEGSDSLAKAVILAKAIERIGTFDLVLTGKQSIDSSSGNIPPGIAERLNVGHICNVKKIETLESDGTIIVQKSIEEGFVRIKAKLPLVLALSKEINEPRTPSLKYLLRLNKRNIHIITNNELNLSMEQVGLSGSATRIVSKTRLERAARGISFEGQPDGSIDALADELKKTNIRSNDFLYDRFKVRNSIEHHKVQYLSDENTGGRVSFGGICIFIELHDNEISSVAYELIDVAQKLSARIGKDLRAIMIGNHIEERAREVIRYGIDEVWLVDDQRIKEYEEDVYVTVITCILLDKKPDIFLGGHTVLGNSLFPRIAARMNAGLVSNCVQLFFQNGILLHRRPMCDGNWLETVMSQKGRPLMSTLRQKVFTPAKKFPNRRGRIVSMKDIKIPGSLFEILNSIFDQRENNRLSEAEIIVAGGRGMQNAQSFVLLFELAKIVSGAVGASRACVDAGWVPYSFQIGQTGKTVNPKIYIACGISGAGQHIAGMSASRFIIAINTDRNAPIFRHVNFGIVGNVFEVLPEMIKHGKRLFNSL